MEKERRKKKVLKTKPIGGRVNTDVAQTPFLIGMPITVAILILLYAIEEVIIPFAEVVFMSAKELFVLIKELFMLIKVLFRV